MALPLLPLLLAGGGALASGVSRMIPTSADKENKRRLDELKRQRELTGLGFTPDELEGLGRSLQAGAQRQLEQSQEAAMQGMANFAGQGAGVGADMATRAGEQRAQIQSQVDDKLVGLDLQERRRLEQEMEDRFQRQGQRQADVASGIGDLVEDVLGIGVGAMGSNQLTEGTANVVGKNLGLTPEQEAELRRALANQSTFQDLSKF